MCVCENWFFFFTVPFNIWYFQSHVKFALKRYSNTNHYKKNRKIVSQSFIIQKLIYSCVTLYYSLVLLPYVCLNRFTIDMKVVYYKTDISTFFIFMIRYYSCTVKILFFIQISTCTIKCERIKTKLISRIYN